MEFVQWVTHIEGNPYQFQEYSVGWRPATTKSMESGIIRSIEVYDLALRPCTVNVCAVYYRHFLGGLVSSLDGGALARRCALSMGRGIYSHCMCLLQWYMYDEGCCHVCVFQAV